MTDLTKSQGVAIGPFIDGQRTASDSSETIEVINPSTATRLFSIPAGSERDADKAVRSARCAFAAGGWSETAPSARKQVLHKWAELVAGQAAYLDSLDAEEMGKPIQESFCNATAASGLIQFFAEAVDKVLGDVYTTDPSTLVLQRRVPRGVVAAVVPWNFPTYNAALKVAPALAAGNSVVLKPSELSSRSALHMAELAMRAGLPAGVLNVVPGRGESVGRALGLHSQVDMVTFTGSTEVGKLMLQFSGQSNMKYVTTECGGKSPHIVFSDTHDVGAVADTIARELLTNQGQICSVGSRLIIQHALAEEMLHLLQTRMRDIVIGDACDPRTTFGPLASEAQLRRVLGYIDKAQAEGAALLCGGESISSKGYFVQPTIFKTKPTTTIAKEEVFGPVLSVLSFNSTEEALNIANDTIYGLMANVWTRDSSTAMTLAKKIRSSVIVNSASPKGEGPGHAFSAEPARQSGLGAEGGMAGMETYMRRQLIWFNHA